VGYRELAARLGKLRTQGLRTEHRQQDCQEKFYGGILTAMFGSNQLHKLAFGGCLTIAILALPVHLNAQDDPKETPAPIEESQGITPETPARQNDASGHTTGDQEPAPDSAHSETITIEEPIEPGCDARCQAAEQREKDGLVTQQSMADSTLNLVRLTYWQVGIGVLGLIALFYTLHLSRGATRAAIQAAEAAKESVTITSDTAKQQLRAYLNLSAAKISMEDDGRVHVKLTFKNGGQTPAYRVTIKTTLKATSFPFAGPFDVPPPRIPGRPISRATTGAGSDCISEMSFPNLFDIPFRNNVNAGTVAFFAYGKVEYVDIFDSPHTTSFRYMHTGKWGGSRGMDVCDDGNQAD
jgi:hypothetical protein